MGCFKEVGFDCIIDSKIIIENDSDLAALLPENDQIEDNINFYKDLKICNQISENWESAILDNFVERCTSIHQKEEMGGIEDDLSIEIPQITVIEKFKCTEIMKNYSIQEVISIY